MADKSAAADVADVESGLLAHLNSAGEVPDSRSFASSLGVPHLELEGVIKSLSALTIVDSTDIIKETWVLTEEAKGYAAKGSPEAQLVAAIPPDGASKDVLKSTLGDAFAVAMEAAARNKWIEFQKGNKDLVLRKVQVESVKDELQEHLRRLENEEEFFDVPDEVINDLVRRKLIVKGQSLWYSVKKGIGFDMKMETLARAKALLEYYASRCLSRMAYDIVNKLESTYLFVKDIPSGDLIAKIDSCLLSSVNDQFRVPSTPDNIFAFDEYLRQVCRLRGEMYTCSVAIGKVIKKILNIVKRNLESGKKISTRGLYYQDVSLFEKQRRSDDYIISVCLMLEATRTSLNIYASSRGLIKGPITLEGPGFKVDCDNGGILGTIIPVEASTISNITVKPHIAKINFILVSEKETAFMELSGLNITGEHSCVIITARGEPDMSTRAVLCKLQKFFPRVPIYALVDPNPYGIEIYCTYRFGSQRMAHENLGYSVPKLQWIGVYPSQLTTVLNPSCIFSTTKAVVKKALSLLDKDHISNDELLASELKWIFVNEKKADIECTADLGPEFLLSYVVSTITMLMAATKQSNGGAGKAGNMSK